MPWRRILSGAFLLLVLVVLVHFARSVDWRAVAASIQATPLTVLGRALLLSVVTLAFYSCMDLLGRHYTGHDLPVGQVMRVNFISYAFNLNLGSLIGAIGFRLRLYAQLGLNRDTITRIISLSVLSNWLGYLVLGGLVFTFRPLELPSTWRIGSRGLSVLGPSLLALAGFYILLCLRQGTQGWRVRGRLLRLPPPGMVAAQLMIACGHWLAMAAILFILLRGAAPYSAVLGVLLVAAVAGVVTHIPAGLGVLEAVFIALLSHRVPVPQLLAVLLTYRTLYYLLPLGVAVLMYLAFEAGRAAAFSQDSAAIAPAATGSAGNSAADDTNQDPANVTNASQPDPGPGGRSP